MKTIANISTTCAPPTLLHAEHDLIAAIFRQAMIDLRATADLYAQASARRFWRGDAGDLAWWCTLAGLDMQQVQRRVLLRYPEVLAPRQLELALEVAS
jgi:hypothetical protein